MPTAMVLGANGQDGSYLSEALVRRGYQVIGVGRQPAARYRLPADRFSYRALDLAGTAGLRRLLEECRPDVVFHAAAIHGSAGFRYEDSWDRMVQVNVLSAHAVLEHARAQAPGLRFVYASSSKIFPDPLAGPISEATPHAATCLYSIGKIATLELMRQYRARHRVAAANLILFNHESPRRPATYFWPRIAQCIARARREPQHRITVKTLDFRADWSSAEELMDLAVDVAEKAPAEDFVFASGVTWHGRQAVEAAFARHGLDYRRHLDVELPPQDPGPEFQVLLDRLEARTGRRPRRTLDAIVDELVAQAAAA